MCFIWFALVGGTAIDLELSGVGNGAIANAAQADKLFVMLDVILGENLAYVMSLSGSGLVVDLPNYFC